MAWFKRQNKGIQTPTEKKKDIPKGLWYKSPTGKIVDTEELQDNFYVSPEDDYHVRIGSREYFSIMFDNKYKELNASLTSKDPLKFEDNKKYTDRLKAAKEKTNLNDAIRTAVGKSMGNDIVIACMDFSFIGGSMGSVVGEKIARAIDYSLKKKIPLVIISMPTAGYVIAPLAVWLTIATTLVWGIWCINTPREPLYPTKPRKFNN